MNVFSLHACVQQLPAVRLDQVETKLLTFPPNTCEKLIRIHEAAAKFLQHLRPNCVATSSDAWSDRRGQVFPTASKFSLHLRRSGLNNPLDRPSPAGMKISDDPFARIDDQHGNTVRCQDGQQLPCPVRHQAIPGLKRGRVVDTMHNCRVYLSNGHQLCTPLAATPVHKLINQPFAVAQYRFPLVFRGKTKIQLVDSVGVT